MLSQIPWWVWGLAMWVSYTYGRTSGREDARREYSKLHKLENLRGGGGQYGPPLPKDRRR